MTAAWCFAALGLVSGCLDRPVGITSPRTTNVFVDVISQESIQRIDLLFMIDNSRSMSDKQLILRDAVPDLLRRLVAPGCVDGAGNLSPAPGEGEDCDEGLYREFTPVEDINIAVVSSSLGDSGANYSCLDEGSNDGAHLMGSLARGGALDANEFGFLQWRPGAQVDALVESFQQMVGAVGENGCGWEASLESWYRFLVDPSPYRSLARVDCADGTSNADCVTPERDAEGGVSVDTTLLAQRNAFLRDDSLVAVILLSDENDCSIQAQGQYWVVAHTENPMYRGSSACDADPNDPCCYSCPLGPPNGCEADPICAAASGQLENRLPDPEDGRNLRCFDQKRRFGFDFLYPTSRYVRALSEPLLCVSRPDLALENCPEQDRRANPLFEAGLRDSSSVFFGGIVGVPWQLIASEFGANQTRLAANELRFKTYEELGAEDWSAIVGQPGVSPPGNLLMVESTEMRTLDSATSPINGREYDTSQGSGVPDDLQYACIMELPQARRCADVEGADLSCDCDEGRRDRPLCERFPGDMAPGDIQYWAKAYPGLRHLEVLRGHGEVSGNAIVASICARNVLDRDAPDYGYRPAMTAILDRLKEKLNNRCLPRTLDVAKDGSVPCSLMEVRFGEDECFCDAETARIAPDPDVESVIRETLSKSYSGRCAPDDPTCTGACVCGVEQVRETTQRLDCQNSVQPPNVEGWCYIADTPEQKIGNPQLVADCPPTQRRLLRFAGEGLATNSVTFVACAGATFRR